MSNYLEETLENLPELAKLKRKENDVFYKRLKRGDKKALDKNMQQIHEEVFACTDCLQCANCCKTTGPLLTKQDIERLAKRERMKSGAFIDAFCKVDVDGEYAFKTMPCMFLADDNSCLVYDIRPKACREYPHTDRNKQFQILDITRKNVDVCPAVYEITERLKKEMSVIIKEKTNFRRP